eukprot:3941414-Rhodomonas_salina.1
MVLCDTRYCHNIWCYASVWCYVLYSTAKAYGGMQCSTWCYHSRWCYAISRNDEAYGAMQVLERIASLKKDVRVPPPYPPTPFLWNARY